jgi:hypothetical protein
MWTLALLLVSNEDEFFGGGEDVAEVRLEILGILVGVSLELLETEFISEADISFDSFEFCEPLVPTDGEPAIVGS